MQKILAGIMLVMFVNFCYAQTEPTTQTPKIATSPASCLNPTVILHPTTKSTLVDKHAALIIDEFYSPYTGAALNRFFFEEYKLIDDSYLYDSAGKINFFWGMGRIGKIIAEGFFSRYLMIVQHEIFGHGYRGREFGFSAIGYKTGVFNGWTRFYLDEFNALSYPQQAALMAGGVEATTILSQQIRKDWFLTNQIDRRDARFYFSAAMDQPLYILGTTDETTSAGNDISGYVQGVNSWYGSNVLTVSKLRNKVWWDFLDPNLYYAIYSVGTYIFESSAYTNMYMFNIKGYRYLPTPRLILAPWGPEFQLQNNIVTPNCQLLQVNLRYGKTSFIKSYGIDVLMEPIYRYKGFTFGNKLYLWNQPQYSKQNTAIGVKNGFGIADYLSVEHRITCKFSAWGEFGYKTAGFIQGNPLGNSWVWRLGLKMRA